MINAGGLINVYQEYIGYNREIAMNNTEKIYDTTLAIFAKSQAENIHTQKAATELAENRINAILKLKSTY